MCVVETQLLSTPNLVAHRNMVLPADESFFMVSGPLKFHDRRSQFANRCTAAAVIIFVVMRYNFRLLCFFIHDLSNPEWSELIIKNWKTWIHPESSNKCT